MNYLVVALSSLLIAGCGGGGDSGAGAGAAPALPAAVTNVAPIANAGVAQSVLVSSVVTLDGSTSTDANSDLLTYVWSLATRPANSAASLSALNTAKPTFTADVGGTYVANLTVNDGKLNSSVATVSITASTANAAPVADAGAAQSVVAGSVVTLDGSASSDANRDVLSYVWTLDARPAGSVAALTAGRSPTPVFVADMAGIYTASLTVNDGSVNSNAATINVTASVANAAPVANAGVAQNVVQGSVVTLNGNASSDANNDPLTYAWTLVARPVGSAATLSSGLSATPKFTADMGGTYVASLIVNDGKVSSSAATVSITVSLANAAPVASAGPALKAVTGTTVTLDGSSSYDANGDPLTFNWIFTTIPPGSAAVLNSATGIRPTFSADVSGTYVASLVVNDGKVNSTAKTVAITAVSDLSQLFGTATSSSSIVSPGSPTQYSFTFSITNNSSESFALTKYEVSSAGTVIGAVTDAGLLSGGQLTAGENVGISLSTESSYVSWRSVYYLTLIRTGQQITVSYTW